MGEQLPDDEEQYDDVVVEDDVVRVVYDDGDAAATARGQDNDWRYNKIISGNKSTVTLMSLRWKRICDEFVAATNRGTVDLSKIEESVEEDKGEVKEKSDHNKELLIFQKRVQQNWRWCWSQRSAGLRSRQGTGGHSSASGGRVLQTRILIGQEVQLSCSIQPTPVF